LASFGIPYDFIMDEENKEKAMALYLRKFGDICLLYSEDNRSVF